MRVRAILFDYGGTLDGEASHWLDRFVALYREAGVTLPFAQLKAAFYAADEVCYHDPRIPEASLTELMDFHVRVQLDRLGLPDTQLHRRLVDRFVTASMANLDASHRVLERLRPGFLLGVVSNFYGNVERILRDAGFGPLLTVVADSHRIGLSKPDPAIYRWAADRLALPVDEIVHVGDSYERDVVAARNAGLRTAWLVGPRSLPDADERAPELRLRSLDELLPYLDML